MGNKKPASVNLYSDFQAPEPALTGKGCERGGGCSLKPVSAVAERMTDKKKLPEEKKKPGKMDMGIILRKVNEKVPEGLSKELT